MRTDPFIRSMVAVFSLVVLFAARLVNADSSQNKADDSISSWPEKWSSFIVPGKLSKAHQSLDSNCASCHEPFKGPNRERCVICHAAPSGILQKQNTSFHSSIASCSGCHIEHQGREARITRMDHTHLALVGSEMLQKQPDGKVGQGLSALFAASRKGYHGTDRALEKTLNCNSCHANQDKHRSLFGSDCSACHESLSWTIADFRHPSSSSRECAECHQAPPSHYMMHFQMVSEVVAGVEHAQLRECYRCHQTTAWNDIKGVGWYKHH